MNVLQLLTTVDPEALVAAYNETYDYYDGENSMDVAHYREDFLPDIRNHVLVQTGMKVEMDHHRSAHDDPVDDFEHYQVSVRIDGKSYSMDFIPWGEILAAEVENHVPDLPELMQAMCIFWELTRNGLEEDMIMERDRIDDMMADVHGVLKGGESSPFDSQSLNSLLEQLKESYPSVEDDFKRMEANAKTLRFYKNGILQEDYEEQDLERYDE